MNTDGGMDECLKLRQFDRRDTRELEDSCKQTFTVESSRNAPLARSTGNDWRLWVSCHLGGQRDWRWSSVCSDYFTEEYQEWLATLRVAPPGSNEGLASNLGVFPGWSATLASEVAYMLVTVNGIRLHFLLAETPKCEGGCVMQNKYLTCLRMHGFINPFSSTGRIAVLNEESHAKRFDTNLVQYQFMGKVHKPRIGGDPP